MANKFDFKQVLKNFERAKQTLPRVLGTQGTNFFLNSFRKQGWEDKNFDAWEVPQRRRPGTRAYRYARKSDRTRAILIDKGRLRRDVAASLKVVSFKLTKWSVAVPYGVYVNEKRQFMGDSMALRKMQERKIKQIMDSIWK
jgi:hypothetical protein